MLFNIFINDMFYFINDSKIVNYAADNIVYRASTEKQMYGNSIINDDEKTKGTFTFDQTGEHISGIFVGSRVNNTHFLTGAIRGIEILHKT